MQLPTDTTSAEDINIVEHWLNVDKVRWVAGIFAGWFAGLVAFALAGLMSVAAGSEFWFPIKLMATVVMGPFATETGTGFGAVIVGLLVIEAICGFWGFVFGHFVKTNQLSYLLPMGLVWGLFSWIFIWNLFLHAERTIIAANISPAVTFPVCVTYGLSLTVVAFLDRALRGSSSSAPITV